MIIYKKLAQLFPELPLKLRQAKMAYKPEEYIQRNVFLAALTGPGLCLIAFLFLQEPLVFLLAPVGFVFAFFYFMRQVDLKIEKTKDAINREIIYAGRFLIIEIQSGVPIYDAFNNIQRNYETVGKYFGDIVREVDFGTSLEDALDNAIEMSPSPQLRKILWQVLNSLRTGADVQQSLDSVLSQIVREQQIEMKEYGRQLNPMAMFYMMIAIIVPSLGTTMLVVLATFVGFSLPLSVLMIIVGLVGFIQFMFLAFIKSSRPPMAL
jgi:pilus assembly protein TadC